MKTLIIPLRVFLVLVFVSLVFQCIRQPKPVIELWYGEEQYFGRPGNTQPFINILGNISSGIPMADTWYSINTGENITFQLGSDLHRLAEPGDFNIEFRRDLLHPGWNELTIAAEDSMGGKTRKTIRLHYTDGLQWPLPYAVSWDTVKNIQDVVQVLDGKWKLDDEGVRVVHRYYDRTLAFGDASWKDYEVSVEITFHDYTQPYAGPPNYNVSHAAIASRWPGFDADEFNPYRKWFPLGATCEFRLSDNLDSCSFRILGGGRLRNQSPDVLHTILLEKKYIMKTRTRSAGNSSTLYQAKLWLADEAEPVGWDIEFLKNPEEVFSGCALILAHHTEVTFGRIEVIPLE